jgi:soluble lytic murein transglycosylase
VIKRLFFLLVCLGLSAFAYSLDYIKNAPKSFARDFVIERFLEQNITSDEARLVYALLKSPKKAHKKLLLERTGDSALKTDLQCEQLENLELNSSCLLKNLSLSKLTKKLMDKELTHRQIQELAQKIKEEDENSFLILSGIASGNPAVFLASRPKLYLKAFFNSHKNYRRAVFNISLDLKLVEGLSKESDFARFVKFSLFDKKLPLLAESIVKVDVQSGDGEALFYIGLLSLKAGDTAKAKTALEQSMIMSNDAKKDRARFWLYLITKDEEWLRRIMERGALNFYSANASERLGVPFPNYKKLVLNDEKESPIDIKDPFEWLTIENSLSKMKKGELVELSKKFDAKGLEPFYLRIKEAKGEATANVFLLNYTEHMKDASIDEKALFLAIARQERAFIPSDVSSAYALGVMQIIPLLAEELDGKYKNKRKLTELFDPKYNVPLAIKHFQKLRAKNNNEVIFVAMSFNAGEGFFKRVTDEGLFAFDDEKTNKYEPFWSIENIPYDETRHYVKKVATNFVVYKKILGEKASLSQILKNLESPHQTVHASIAE